MYGGARACVSSLARNAAARHALAAEAHRSHVAGLSRVVRRARVAVVDDRRANGHLDRRASAHQTASQISIARLSRALPCDGPASPRGLRAAETLRTKLVEDARCPGGAGCLAGRARIVRDVADVRIRAAERIRAARPESRGLRARERRGRANEAARAIVALRAGRTDDSESHGGARRSA